MGLRSPFQAQLSLNPASPRRGAQDGSPLASLCPPLHLPLSPELKRLVAGVGGDSKAPGMDIQGTVIGWILWRERWRLLEWTTFAQGRGMLGMGGGLQKKGGLLCTSGVGSGDMLGYLRARALLLRSRSQVPRWKQGGSRSHRWEESLRGDPHTGPKDPPTLPPRWAKSAGWV